MALRSGMLLSHYRLDEKIGEGGMGVVWRATDTTLGRPVAIKALPEAFSEDPERLSRFDREAKLLASLNHPNIAIIHGLHHSEGIAYLAMELVEGEDLAARLARGAVPPDEAAEIAKQVAQALEAAHESGVIHRDLKPANIQLTPDGRVKVLDFGLAKAFEGEPGASGSASLSPTMTAAATRAGMILGTAAYMSPEQARGRSVDRRSDIWSFGCVCYEMLTGRRLFEGETVSDTLAAVLRADPDWSALPPSTPAGVRNLIRRCLIRDPKQRLQAIGEARIALEARGASDIAVPAAAPMPARRGRERLAWSAAGLLAVLCAILMVASFRRPVLEASVVHSEIVSPPGTSFDFLREKSGALSLSPDGRHLTFSLRTAEGDNSLYIRSLDSNEARPLSGTKGATWPFWSPDSRFIAFFAEGKLKRIDLAGSPAVAICDATDGRSGSWSRDGVIIFAPAPNTPIHQVSASGGTSRPVTRMDEEHGETTHRWASFLPDGRHFLYLAGSHNVGTKSETNAVWASELGHDIRKLVLRVRSNVAYASGHLLYVRDRVLLAQRLDPDRLELTGDPVPLAAKVDYETGFFRSLFAASESGLLVYRAGGSESNAVLAWFGRDGKVLQEMGGAGDYETIALSPDGKRAALVLTDPDAGTNDIWIQDLVRGARTRLTFGATGEFSPVWAPDGSRIVYSVSGRFDHLFARPAAGGEEEEILKADEDSEASDWSADGRTIIYQRRDPKSSNRWGVWALPVGQPEKARPVVDGEFNERQGRLSPDGRWMVYVSDESGRNEVYVVPFPGPGGKWQVSLSGGEAAWWTRGGREIVYIDPGTGAMAVEVRAAGAGIELDSPRLMFDNNRIVTGDITRDGERTLVAIRPEADRNLPLTLIANWPGSLKP